MGKMTISLDEQARTWIEEQAGAEADAYVNELVHRDQATQKAKAELQQMMEEADASGVSERTPQQIWAAAKARYLANHG